MRIDYPFQYTEITIPPRCRKARPVRANAMVRVTIAEVQPKAAPVAVIERGRSFNKGGQWGPYTRTFRVHRGTFFVPLRDRDGGRVRFQVPTAGTWDYAGHETKAKRIAVIRAWARSYIIIRGQVWTAIGEPRYVIQTFGLGRNHGGTALMSCTHYNSNIANAAYYRIDQVKAAIKDAERIALARGDTESVPIRPGSRYEVRRPSALRLNPQRQHGKGDPFLNRVEHVVRGSKSHAEAGVLVMGMALGGG